MTPRLPLPILSQSISTPQSPRDDLSLKRRRLDELGSHSPVPRPLSSDANRSDHPKSPYHYPYSHHPPQHQHPSHLPHEYHYTHGPVSPNMAQPGSAQHPHQQPQTHTPTQTHLGIHPPPPPPPQTLIYPHQQYYPYGDMRYPTPPQPMPGPMPPMGPPMQHHHMAPPPPHLMGHQSMPLGVAVAGPSFALRRPIPARQRTSIACRYCRRRKIRCSGFDPENPDSRCSNCIRFNQECVFIPVSSMASTDKKGSGETSPTDVGPYERLSPTLSDTDKREWRPQPHPTSPTEVRNSIAEGAMGPAGVVKLEHPMKLEHPTGGHLSSMHSGSAVPAPSSPASAHGVAAAAAAPPPPPPPTRSKLSIQNLLG